MNSLPEPTAIDEIDADALRADPARWIQAAQPWVARSLVDGWPLVSAANESDSAFLDYLLGFYSGNQVSAFLGEADIGGRFFYNEDSQPLRAAHSALGACFPTPKLN